MSIRLRRRTPAAIAIMIAVIAGAGAAILFSVLKSGTPERIAAEASQSVHESETRHLFESDNPLLTGAEVSAEVAVGTLNQCSGCITLPPSGDARVDQIAQAWVREDAAIAFDFRDGMRIYFLPDDRNNETWAKEAVASDCSDIAGCVGLELVDLRGTVGVALKADESGPAAISWIEDGYMVEILGKGGQSLDHLMDVAASLNG